MLGLTDALLELFNKLETSVRIRLFVAATLRSQWFRPPAEIYDAAEVSHRRAALELAKLVQEGWLERHEKGARNQELLVRFEPGVAPIKLIGAVRSLRSGRPDQVDRGDPSPPTRRTQARDHAQQRSDPDPSLDPRSMDQRVRPSGGVQGGEPAADGRTEGSKEPRAELRNALLAWVQERHNVEPRLSTPGLMRLVGAGATEHELRAFLTDLERGTHPCFDGVEHAQFRFGAACTVDRFEKWRASRARPPRRGPSVREQLELEPSGMPAPDEMAAIAELVRARLK